MAQKPIILDRSRLEQFASCPRQGYLNTIWDALKAQAEGKEVWAWEKKILDEADPILVKAIKKVCLQSKDSRIGECGTKIHELIEKAFKECKNDTSIIPQWFVDNLPKIQPNLTPMAIRHARHIADMLSEFHVAVIDTELQVSLVIYPEIPSKKAFAIPSGQTDFSITEAKNGDAVAVSNADSIKEICLDKGKPAVIITMRFDLLASGKDCLHIIDHKTGFKRRSNTEAAESFQANFGAFLLFQQKEYEQINTIHFWYYETMWGTKAYARFDRLSEHPRLPGLTTEQALKGRVMATVDLFLTGNKECWPLPDSCTWCDMIQFCPLANMDAKEIADNPKLYVDKMVVMEVLLKRMKDTATQWIKVKGAIVGSKVMFTKKIPQERFTAGFEDKDISKLTATNNEELDGHFK